MRQITMRYALNISGPINAENHGYLPEIVPILELAALCFLLEIIENSDE